MILDYHRPQTLDEALTLLSKPNTVPLGGGTRLSQPGSDSVSVVDIQNLGLDTLRVKGNELELGAALTLQALLKSKNCPETLKTPIKLEAPLNIRNSATVAGSLVASNGRSTFTTALMALDAKIELKTIENKSSTSIALGEYLPILPKGLIVSIAIPLNVKLAFEFVSKTPADKPIVCAAVAQWKSGRTRLTLGGYGKAPLLAMDGTESEGIETAAKNAYHEANDEWASAQYRMDVAATLAKRCLGSMS